MAVIHCEPGIPWHAKRAGDMADGLRALGLPVTISSSRQRVNDSVAILFGTTLWREVEAAEGDWLLVDRASIGDPEYVSLVWNGHGRRGDHKVPIGYDGTRWQRLRCRPLPEQDGWKRVLCGQTEPYSPHYSSLEQWYSEWRATHFRKHPSGCNPTGLPECSTWDDVSMAITLNSSVAVDALLSGVPEVVVDDEGGMAYEWQRFGSRVGFFEWLAWTQWGWDEIASGKIAHLFDMG